jgi:hypothetical protein
MPPLRFERSGQRRKRQMLLSSWPHISAGCAAAAGADDQGITKSVADCLARPNTDAFTAIGQHRSSL